MILPAKISELLARLRKLFPRLSNWGIVSVLGLAGIALIAASQLPVILLKVTLVAIGATVGYWIDRALYPYARPHEANAGKPSTSAMLRRAIIVGAVILSISLGL